MNRMYLPKLSNNLKPHMMLFIISAIVVISSPHASAKATDNISLPKQMAGKLFMVKTAEDAFDTPYFDATKAPLTLKGLKGRGTVVNFWATWCVPCVREMPSLDRLAASLKGTGVDVLPISEDRKPLKDIPAFMAKHGFKNMGLFYDIKSKLSRKLGIYGLPSTFLINADGKSVGLVVGTLEWDDPEIKDFLVKSLTTHSQPVK